MKLTSKLSFLFIALSILTLLSFTLDQRGDDKKKKKKKGKNEEVDPMIAYREEVAGYRSLCKKALKPYRYSFGRTTFFNYKNYRTKKEVEVSLVLDATYKFNFNASAVTEKKIIVRVYNRSSDYKNRIVLFEKKGVGSNSFSFTSKELLIKLKEQYRAKGYDQSKIDLVSLDRIYIDYIIPAVDLEQVENEYTGKMRNVQKKGAIVFASGYENLEASD